MSKTYGTFVKGDQERLAETPGDAVYLVESGWVEKAEKKDEPAKPADKSAEPADAKPAAKPAGV